MKSGKWLMVLNVHTTILTRVVTLPLFVKTEFEHVHNQSNKFLKKELNENIYAVLCAFWHDLHNLKNVKNTHGGSVTLSKIAVKVTLFHVCFSRFLNCRENGTNCPKHQIQSQELIKN